jgi:hypothetical protein
MTRGTEKEITELIGKTIVSVSISQSNNEIFFTTSDNETYKMYHDQDCCESVAIGSFEGNTEDLIGQKVIKANEEVDSSGEGEFGESSTTTKFFIESAKGRIEITWHGSSNGYYSESVNFQLMNQEGH